MNECWICGQPAIWLVKGEKQGTPIVLVEFHACEKHVPFVIEAKEVAHATAK